MGGMLEDMERRIDEERARYQRKKIEEAEAKAKREAEKAKKQNNSNSILW